MVTEHFSQSLIYDTKKYKDEKELILSMFCILTEKIFGLTHIWKGKKDLGNSTNKTNFFLCVRQDHGKNLT